MAVGAEPQRDGGVHFRVWAPTVEDVTVELQSASQQGSQTTTPLAAEAGGYFSGTVAEARVGDIYKYRVSHGSFPDPVSRFQPEGVHGFSQIVDPTAFCWTDSEWRGVSRDGQVLYEMHVGTLTPQGTWSAAIRELDALAELGITVIELMPVAEFPGRFGWGYDGVDFFAPTRLYGVPDEMRAFVDRAHALGIGVILDVVYNHLGPDGNYLREFSAAYFCKRASDWGDSLNLDGANCAPVREFVLANAAYWIREYHLDGLRLDATQQIFDDSPEHIIAAIARVARAAGGLRSVYVIGENELQHADLVRPLEAGGFGLDALWNDDLHHSAMVALDGRREAYYCDYRGQPQEFISAMKWGFLYQGQRYEWQSRRRGTPSLDLNPTAFVSFLQNHDQVANSLRGARIHQLTDPARLRAMTALILLGPATPMLFQGQEFAASTPFLYFADHHSELAALVADGRRKFLAQFPRIAAAERQTALDAPHAEETFLRSKIDPADRERHAEILRLHCDLLRLRREDPIFKKPRRRGVDGAVLSNEAFVLRFFGEEGSDRLLIVNLGTDFHLDAAPEPLLAPLAKEPWRMIWSSEGLEYGGQGTPPLDTDDNWRIPARSAVVLSSHASRSQASNR